MTGQAESLSPGSAEHRRRGTSPLLPRLGTCTSTSAACQLGSPLPTGTGLPGSAAAMPGGAGRAAALPGGFAGSSVVHQQLPHLLAAAAGAPGWNILHAAQRCRLRCLRSMSHGIWLVVPRCRSGLSAALGRGACDGLTSARGTVSPCPATDRSCVSHPCPSSAGGCRWPVVLPPSPPGDGPAAAPGARPGRRRWARYTRRVSGRGAAGQPDAAHRRTGLGPARPCPGVCPGVSRPAPPRPVPSRPFSTADSGTAGTGEGPGQRSVNGSGAGAARAAPGGGAGRAGGFGGTRGTARPVAPGPGHPPAPAPPRPSGWAPERNRVPETGRSKS